MNVYYTRGTIGDTYNIICKLYSIAIKKRIICKHYTKHKNIQPVIKEIFALLPNIKVEFLEKTQSKQIISGEFQYRDCIQEKKYNLLPTYYPEFSLPNISYLELPENYIVIQPISGIRKNRRLRLEEINKIVKDSNLISVFVEKDKYELNISNVLNFSGQTNIREDMAIVKGSQHFYGPQGFLSHVALSQKVSSTIYLSNDWTLNHFRDCVEAIKEWNKFLTKKKI